jgi:hypothetical protein
MKKLTTTLALAIVVVGTIPRLSYADTDRFEVWDRLDVATATLFNEQQIDEFEDWRFEEVLGLGRTGEIEEAINALQVFTKDSRNIALREVARNTFAVLLKQQKEAAHNWAMHASDKPACTLEMKVCPSGEIVGREGAKCAFAECAER